MKERKLVVRYVVCLLAVFLIANVAMAQGQGKKTYVFKGQVTEVDAGAKKLAVKNEKIEGWMDAMTMNYQVDNPEVLKQLKVGDRIEATVYDGDYKLYKVHVAGKEQKK